MTRGSFVSVSACIFARKSTRSSRILHRDDTSLVIISFCCHHEEAAMTSPPDSHDVTARPVSSLLPPTWPAPCWCARAAGQCLAACERADNIIKLVHPSRHRILPSKEAQASSPPSCPRSPSPPGPMLAVSHRCARRIRRICAKRREMSIHFRMDINININQSKILRR